jgi:haloalkane dehalogenase
MTNYRAPFAAGNTTQPLQQYINDIPSNNPSINQLIAAYSNKLTHSNLPKLMLYSIPGFMTTMATLMWAKDNLPHLEIIDAGEDLHYALETHPTFIGQMISVWLQSIEQGK